MSTHQSLPKPANANKKSDILPIPAQSKPHPVIDGDGDNGKDE